MLFQEKLEPAPPSTPVPSTQLKTTNEAVKLPTLTTTIKPIQITTRQSSTSTTLMMYPRELGEDFGEAKHQFNELPIETISLPFSLLSLFGGKPKSSQLKIAPPSSYPQNQLATLNSETPFKYQEISNVEKNEDLPNFSVITDAKTDKLLKITTVSSSSKFSIISTSTETSIPHIERTTNSKPIEDKVDTKIFDSSKSKVLTAK